MKNMLILLRSLLEYTSKGIIGMECGTFYEERQNGYAYGFYL